MITFSEYYTLLMEDLQSSLNQAKNILQNNNAGENVQNIISKLEQIYNEVQFEDEQHRQANKDSNIPALAFWIVADPNFDRIREDYRQYVNTRSLYQKNFLINSMENLKKEISNRKLFKPSEEKLSLIKQTFAKVAETIHSQYKPVVKANDKKFVAGEANEDVVYEDDVITVYRADSKAKCIRYGAGSSLCISVKGGGNYYWSYRMGNMRNDGLGMTTYFVYWKDGSNRILIDALGDEDGPANKHSWNPITPNTDRDVTAMGLIKQYPELAEPFLKGVFQFLPYGEKEERYAWIGNNINYLLDPRLETLEDYEMYIEGLDDDGDDYNDSVKYEGWNRLSEKLGVDGVSYLVKKYAGLGNIIDIETQKTYLTPRDREWYLTSIIAEKDEDGIMAYLQSVKGVIGNEIILVNLLNQGDGYNYLADFLEKIIRVDDAISGVIRGKLLDGIGKDSSYSSWISYVVDFFMGRNVSSKILEKLLEDPFRPGVSNIPTQLIRFWKRNNIPIPKVMYKSILSEPYMAYKYTRYMMKELEVDSFPNSLIRAISKNPMASQSFIKDLIQHNIYNRENSIPIPKILIKSVLSEPTSAYFYLFNSSYRDEPVDLKDFSDDFFINMFSNGRLGYDYAKDNNGFGAFFYRIPVKNAIYENILKHPKLAAYYMAHEHRAGKNEEFAEMARESAKNYTYTNESYNYSQLDTIVELSKYNK